MFNDSEEKYTTWDLRKATYGQVKLAIWGWADLATRPYSSEDIFECL
jgi:hypothetical protein